MVERGLLPAEGETALRPEDVQRVQIVEAFDSKAVWLLAPYPAAASGDGSQTAILQQR
jgi:hypothetical protein